MHNSGAVEATFERCCNQRWRKQILKVNFLSLNASYHWHTLQKPHHLLHCNEAKAMWKIICFDMILKQWSFFQTIGWENNKCLAGEMEQ